MMCYVLSRLIIICTHTIWMPSLCIHTFSTLLNMDLYAYMYLLSHLSSPLYLTWSSKQCYVWGKYVFPVVVVFLAVVMDDLQSVFSSPWYPLPLSENQSTAIHNYTTTYIFLEIFFANAVKPCFSFWKLANALSAFNALTFWCIGKRIWVKINW